MTYFGYASADTLSTRYQDGLISFTAGSVSLNRDGCLTLTGKPGQAYRLEMALTLGGPWSPLAVITLTNFSQTWLDAARPSGAANRFYRAVPAP
jgi:hypothetical protein